MFPDRPAPFSDPLAPLHDLLLRLQDPPPPLGPDPFPAPSLLAAAARVLASLTNPLNLGVATGQLLAAPAIWHHHPFPPLPPPDRHHRDLAACLGVLSVYNSAAARVRGGAAAAADDATITMHGQPRPATISCDVWARGVAAGLDGRSCRWRHLLVLTGVLLGMAEHPGLSPGARAALEEAIVRAANLALATEGPAADAPVVLGLGYALPHLSPSRLARLDCDAVLARVVWAVAEAPTFQLGAFLDPIGRDTAAAAAPGRPGAMPGPPLLLHWPAASPSFRAVSGLAAMPLAAALGAVARLGAHAALHARDPGAVRAAQSALVHLSVRVLAGWRALALAGVDPADEPAALSAETRDMTAPVMWELLRRLMYFVVAVLHAVARRCLLDGRLAADAASVAADTLRTLRNLCFVSSRSGAASFQEYIFVYLSAVDALASRPGRCEAFLCEIAPPPLPLPPGPVDRALDLFYLNLVEHLPLAMAPAACEALIVRPALAYLDFPPPPSPAQSSLPAIRQPSSATPRYALGTELFEAAHSAILATMSVPHNAGIAADLIPRYVEALFGAFPGRVSPRQFRVALRAVVAIATPPLPAAASHPDLAEALLEMVRLRALGAATEILVVPAAAAPGAAAASPASEQSALVLSLIDALPLLPAHLVAEWLTVAAGLVSGIRNPALREPARARLWDVLAGGEMDAERAAVGVAWWGGGGGGAALQGAMGGGMEGGAMGGVQGRL